MGTSVVDGDLTVKGQISATTNRPSLASVTSAHFSSDPTEALVVDKQRHRFAIKHNQRGHRRTTVRRSVWFDLDNGAAATIDDVIMKCSKAITIRAARIVYVHATTGTVAGGSAQIGSTLGGTEIVAATNYEDSKAVGTSTAMTIVSGAVAAGGSVFVRHTGVAATQAGQAIVEIEYTIDEEESGLIHTETAEIYVARNNGVLESVEVSTVTAPTGGTTGFTVDVKKGNASTAFASVLSAAIEYDDDQPDKTVVAGSISTDDYLDGDIFQIVVTETGSGGTQGSGLTVVLNFDEEPS